MHTKFSACIAYGCMVVEENFKKVIFFSGNLPTLPTLYLNSFYSIVRVVSRWMANLHVFQ